MRKKLFWAGLFWTLFIIIACLVEGESVPKTSIFSFEHKDKLAHFFFYFVFSILLFSYKVTGKNNLSFVKAGFITFLLASVVGGMVEIGQLLLTKTRSAEWYDMLANCSGSIVGIVVSASYLKIFKFRKASS